MKKAVDYFISGYSCSESIIKEAIEKGLLPEDEKLIAIASSFSGGMSSGCLCGAISGAQMVIGYIHGKIGNKISRELAKQFIDEFKKRNNYTCCKALTRGFDFHTKERKEHCKKMVKDSSEILEEILNSVKEEQKV